MDESLMQLPLFLIYRSVFSEAGLCQPVQVRPPAVSFETVVFTELVDGFGECSDSKFFITN